MPIFSFLFGFLSEPLSLSDILILIIFFILAVIVFIAVVIASISTIIDFIKNAIGFIKNKRLERKYPPNMNDLPDDKFEYLDKHFLMVKFDFARDHIPVSSDDKSICDDLVVWGVFSKNTNGSYKVKKPWKKYFLRDRDLQ